MIFVKPLSAEEKEELTEALKEAKDAKWYRRLKIIQLSSEAFTIPQLVELFDLTEITVRNYIHRYNDGGLLALKAIPQSGRKKKLEAFKGQWEEILHRSPSQFEKLQTGKRNWTLGLLAEYLFHYHGILVCVQTISNALSDAGYSRGRSKLRVTSPDPEYEIKRQRVESLKKKGIAGILSSADSVVSSVPYKPGRLLFFDETDLHWCPDVGGELSPLGEQFVVDSPGKDKLRFLLGSMDYVAGEGLYQIYSRKRKYEFQRHLESLFSMYPDEFLFVVADNASSHTTDLLAPFLEANQERIEVVFLPTYSPHLNLIERLWRHLRQQVTKNRFYESIQHLCEIVIQWLEKLPFEEFLSLIGRLQKA